MIIRNRVQFFKSSCFGQIEVVSIHLSVPSSSSSSLRRRPSALVLKFQIRYVSPVDETPTAVPAFQFEEPRLMIRVGNVQSVVNQPTNVQHSVDAILTENVGVRVQDRMRHSDQRFHDRWIERSEIVVGIHSVAVLNRGLYHAASDFLRRR